MASPSPLPFNLPPVVEKFRKSLDTVPLLVQAQEHTGVDKFYFVAASIVLLIFFVIIGYGMSLVCNIVGFIYPAYASFKAIESKEKTDDSQWLTYWIVYACFNVIELPADIVLSWIPFYHIWKLVFLIWLFHPATLGASVLYRNILNPFLTKHETRIDKVLGSAVQTSGNVLAEAAKISSDVGGVAAARYVNRQTK